MRSIVCSQLVRAFDNSLTPWLLIDARDSVYNIYLAVVTFYLQWNVRMSS